MEENGGSLAAAEVVETVQPIVPDASGAEQLLGKRLQQVRKSKGYTQQTLCEKANLSYSTLAKIERGAIKSPSIFTIQSIAQAMGIGLDELLGLSTAGNGGGTTKQTTKSGVSFVYFDLNDTLVRGFQQAFSRLAEQTGSYPDFIETTFWHYNDEVCRGTMSMTDFDRVLSERLETPIDWAAAYLEVTEAIAPMQDLLRWAAERYNVGVLSNTMPGLLHGLRERGTLPDLPYRAIIDSSEVGSIKPEPRIFELATEAAGVPPHEILLIDDNRSNLIAAEQAGWRVLWFDGYRAEESAGHLRDGLAPAE